MLGLDLIFRRKKLDFGGLNYPSKHLWPNCYVGQISARLSFGNSDAILRMWENWICIWIWTWLHDFVGRCKVDILISI
ncbi:hypothetical protein FEM48_Zijuj04G0153700 [Ziziphus jujuba var. spinosa]|uniref:Uncharacterized protein n=1 Tax=Ziziphus jujuba var. spinosa TaxID=714518 RepID=A0A978VKM7_ZIZJJ|nr:hypothetical protein FEM48_Zijuj04G0153700 [Ziziphus jujuba var. spinosa]